ncbi:cytosol aminopeptidase-like [Rhodnius prolixus]|uniref:Cytosol aminopeptidase n=1 Tax=Rhodnius prolixus TaxID=13249 RepID=R4G463_RHOPR
MRTPVLKAISLIRTPFSRSYCECSGSGSNRTGLVLGTYQPETSCHETGSTEFKFTPTGVKFNEETGGKLKDLVQGAGIRKGCAHVFTNVSNDFAAVAVAGLGPEGLGWNEIEVLDECKENIRIATAHGTRALQDEGMSNILVEPFTNTEAAAESAFLSVWRYQELKNKQKQLATPRLDLYGESDKDGWERGKLKSGNQNLARKLEDTPANLMTPTIFAENAVDLLCPCGVSVEVRDKDWIEEKRMNPFLTVAKGSCEPPLFLEVGYCGGPIEGQPIVLVGKGITFDTGGMCLKKCEHMSEYRADLAGAAVVLAVIKTAAQMVLPMNIFGLIPLCENMLGGLAMKPGDVVIASNGKSITIEDTDNEGRLTLIDALNYSHFFKPCAVVCVSTIADGVRRNLGTSSSATFSTSQALWRELERAGGETGDRLWRLPFWKVYQHRITTDYLNVDVHNVGKNGISGDVCKAAAFLLEFMSVKDFVHIDISGTGKLSNGVGHPYLREGTMTGRPTRTLVQFLYQIACPHTRGDEC